MAEFGSNDPPGSGVAGVPVAGSGSAPGQSVEFDHEALAHLQVQSDEIFLHVQLFIDRGSERNRRQLIDYLQRFRNTLALLEKVAPVYVTEELLTLMQADAQRKIGNRSELARVLSTAAEQLCDYVATLQKDTSISSALPLLPLVNDSRACREESLLSDDLVLAAGIELPVPTPADATDADWQMQRQSWIDFATANHSSYARALLGWWRTGEFEALGPLVRIIGKFATYCTDRSYLDCLSPLFCAAAVVAKAIAEKELYDGPALRSLFAQLERSIHRSSAVKFPDDLLPGDLLRNFLYYVAQTDSTSQTSLELRRRFRLDRIRETALVNQVTMTPTIGVGYHLATAIRAGIANETAPLFTWLKQNPRFGEPPGVIRINVRLTLLEPILCLMGEAEALACLREVNARLEKVKKAGQTIQDDDTQALSGLLTQLDDLLDQSARQSITRGAGVVDRATIGGEDVFTDMATDALLREARGSLRIAANDLALLFLNPDDDSASVGSVTRHLTQIDSALQILPLPEIGALLTGICDLLTPKLNSHWMGKDTVAAALINNENFRPLHPASANQDYFEAKTPEQEIAKLLVSIDYYLACVLQPQPAASQLLVEANDALENAQALVEGRSPMPLTDEPEVPELSMQELLVPMDRIGTALRDYRARPESATLLQIQLALADYRQCAANFPNSQSAQLANAADAWFATLARRGGNLDSNKLDIIEEVHAMIPQLIAQEYGSSEVVSMLDELILQLEADGSEAKSGDNDTESELANAELTITGQKGDDELSLEQPLQDIDLIVDEEIAIDPWDLDPSEVDISTLTLNVDDELLKLPELEPPDAPVDNKLQQVFYEECLGHIQSLEESVRKALQPSANKANRLPNEHMLRALHTLTSSAQTVDASDVLAIVQPLQKAALVKQRLEQSFDAPQTRYIGDLGMALRVRLDIMNKGGDVPVSVRSVEKKLDAFIASVSPGSEENADEVIEEVAEPSSLDMVFAEEADDLQQRLRALIDDGAFDQTKVETALGHLHTLKGSARMVGKSRIAHIIHDLEAQIREAPDLQHQHARLLAGLTSIESMMRRDTALPESGSSNDNETGQAPFQQQGQQKGQAPAKAPLQQQGQQQGPQRVKRSVQEGFQVSEQAFEALLDLTTDLTVKQARLNEELASLREVYQKLRAGAKGWQGIPVSRYRPEFAPLQEIMSSFDEARELMRASLRQAEREQQNASRISADLQQSLVRTRLVRVDEWHDRLKRVIDDACVATGAKVALRVEGGEITLDKSLFRQLSAPLDHIVRNAVVHGIELPEERLTANKPDTGVLTVQAAVDGTDLVLRVHDDGRGINRDALNERARAKGEPEIQTHDDLQRVLFSSGYSSLDTATELAGHGLGLSAVKTAAERTGGSVQLSTASGAGTIITLRIPQRMVVKQAVVVSSGGLLYAIPVNFVESVVIDGSMLAASERYLTYTLEELLSQSKEPQERQIRQHPRPTVLVNVRGSTLAIRFDQILGYRELIMQPLGPQLASLARFIGGSVLPDGRQVMILDVGSLAETGGEQTELADKLPRESLKPVALVVDDSLTMRVATEKMLLRSGIAVRMARDGIEAMDSIATAVPNVIIVDLEMPRLDGMGLLQRLSEEYGSACPPLIVVSSRDDATNRSRASGLGVVRFLAKPFTESALLEAIEAAGLRLPDLTIA